MQAESSVYFKVFVIDGTNESEVRRFAVDRSAVTSFEYMKAKIQSVFLSLQSKPFSLMWKDDEGDVVTISTDDELITALSSIPEDLKKLYVKTSPMKTGDGDIVMDIPFIVQPSLACPPTACGSAGRKRTLEGGIVHEGVVCDACNGPVVGFRYKCIVCEDYDLCNVCEGKNVHPEHLMMRVPVPIGPIHEKSRRLLTKVLRKSGAFNQAECPFMSKRHCKENRHAGEGDAKHGRHHSRGHHGKHGHEEEKKRYEEARKHTRSERHCHRMNNGGWIDMFSSYMNEFANLAGDIGQQAAAAATAHANAASAHANTAAASAGASAQASAPMDTTSEQAAPKSTESQATNASASGAQNGNAPPSFPHEAHEQYLRNVGRTIANILSPMGIDVDIDVRPKTNNEPEKNQSQGETSKPKESTKKDSPLIEINDLSSSDDDISDSDDEAVGRRPEGWTFVGPKHSGVDMDKMAKEFQKHVDIQPPPTNNINTENIQPSVVPQSTGIYPTIPMPPPDSFVGFPPAPVVLPMGPSASPFVVQSVPSVNPTVPSVTPSAPTNVTSPPPAQQPQTPASNIIPGLRPEIAESYNRMLQMGFKDDAGRLIRLLEAKKGNISEVLDVLTMNIPRQ